MIIVVLCLPISSQNSISSACSFHASTPELTSQWSPTTHPDSQARVPYFYSQKVKKIPVSIYLLLITSITPNFDESECNCFISPIRRPSQSDLFDGEGADSCSIDLLSSSNRVRIQCLLFLESLKIPLWRILTIPLALIIEFRARWFSRQKWWVRSIGDFCLVILLSPYQHDHLVFQEVVGWWWLDNYISFVIP